MKKIYHTIEGSQYILKTTTRYTRNFVVAAPPHLGAPIIEVNSTAVNANPTGLDFKTTRPIIPVSYSLSVLDVNSPAANIVDIDMCSPYFAVYEGSTGALLPSSQISLSKMIPLVDRIYYSDDLHFGYNVNYPFAMLSDQDFITMQGYNAIYFFPGLADALTANGTLTGFTLPITSTLLNCTIVFSYFELQN